MRKLPSCMNSELTNSLREARAADALPGNVGSPESRSTNRSPQLTLSPISACERTTSSSLHAEPAATAANTSTKYRQPFASLTYPLGSACAWLKNAHNDRTCASQSTALRKSSACTRTVQNRDRALNCADRTRNSFEEILSTPTGRRQ